jgi:serine/threonine-protein kinase
MSPEQARGRSVDKRADIWAFGAVVWETLTGRRLFEGETVSDVMAAVLRQEIDFDALPPETPNGLVRLLHRCLERDPKNRLHDIADARLEVAESQKAQVRRVESEIPARPHPSRVLRWAPWIIAGAALLALLFPFRHQPAGIANLVRLSILLPEKMTLELNSGDQSQILAISPDGRRVAFTGKSGDESRIFLRDLSRKDPEPLFGTEGGSTPFFSPDGEWIGFVAGDKLKKTAIRGGTPIALAPVPRSRGAAWGIDGTIVFASTVNTPLFRISAAGGEPRPLTSLDEAGRERTHRWPDVVPEGNWVLFTVGTADKPGDYDDARIDAVSLTTGKRHLVYRGASLARYAPPDRLLLARHGDLLAAPFNPTTATVSGPAVPVIQGVSGDPRSGVSYFDASRTGALVHGVGLSAQGASEIVWSDRSGKREPTGIPPGLYTEISLSPDGQKLAYAEGPSGGARSDVWIADLAHSGYFQLTSTGQAAAPTWTRDGASVVFSTPAGDAVLRQRADGSAAAEVLWRSPYGVPITTDSFAPDGSALLVTLNGLPSQADIFRVPLTGDHTAQTLIATPRAEHEGMISPNGRWIAYTGEYESGAQIYVQPYPSLAGRWQISRSGGAGPRWSHDGNELFFVWNDQIFEVPIREAPTFAPGEPRGLFKIESPASREWNQMYDISPDSKRFILLVGQKESKAQPHLDVILNFGRHLDEATR